jgi:hypothetical protein
MLPETAVDADAIEYPALLLHARYGYTVRSAQQLTTATRHALSNGKFNDLLIVSRSGHAYPVAGAKVGSVGAFGGWNLFLNQRIRVELLAAAQRYTIAVDELRNRVFESFQTWEGWQSAENFEEVEANVRRATTVDAIIDALAS